MMKLPVYCALALWVVGAAVAQAPKPEDAAQAVATPWLALLDDAKYPEAWTGAAKIIQTLVPLERWNTAMAAVRLPLGKVQSRTLESAKFSTSMPGAPDGEYVTLRYATVFAHQSSAIETVTPMRETDGTWKVSGYYVK